MNRLILRAFTGAAIALCLGGVASADTVMLQYTISGDDNGGAALYKGNGSNAVNTGYMTGTFVLSVTTATDYTLDSANITVTSTAGGFMTPINFSYNGVATTITDPSFDLTGSDATNTYTLHIQFTYNGGNVTPLGVNSFERQNPIGPGSTITQYADTFGSDSMNAGSTTGTLTPTVVPEPSSIVLASSALAIAACGGWLRRRRAVASRLARA